MRSTTGGAPRALASCHGYLAVASDGPLGAVETPLFAPDSDEPDFLIIQVADEPRPRRPIVSTAFVDHVDRTRKLVYLRATGAEIAHLPESLPLAGRTPKGRRA